MHRVIKLKIVYFFIYFLHLFFGTPMHASLEWGI